MKKRKLFTMFILTIVTLGIYYLYWLIVAGKELGDEVGARSNMFLTILLVVFTFGLGAIYLFAKYSVLTQQIASNRNEFVEEDSTLLIVLTVFGCGLLSMFIVQDKINGFVEDKITA